MAHKPVILLPEAVSSMREMEETSRLTHQTRCTQHTRQIGDQTSLLLAEGHDACDQQLKVFRTHPDQLSLVLTSPPRPDPCPSPSPNDEAIAE